MVQNPLEGLTLRDTQGGSRQHSPDEDTLVVVAFPEAAVALVGHGEDVRRHLSHVVPAVALHRRAIVQPRDALVGVHRGHDGANVGLQAHSTPRAVITCIITCIVQQSHLLMLFSNGRQKPHVCKAVTILWIKVASSFPWFLPFKKSNKRVKVVPTSVMFSGLPHL